MKSLRTLAEAIFLHSVVAVFSLLRYKEHPRAKAK